MHLVCENRGVVFILKFHCTSCGTEAKYESDLLLENQTGANEVLSPLLVLFHCWILTTSNPGLLITFKKLGGFGTRFLLVFLLYFTIQYRCSSPGILGCPEQCQHLAPGWRAVEVKAFYDRQTGFIH